MYVDWAITITTQNLYHMLCCNVTLTGTWSEKTLLFLTKREKHIFMGSPLTSRDTA